MNNINLIISIWSIWLISAAIIYALVIIISYLANCRTGLLFRLSSFWIGIHYSKSCKRYCINLIPCVTLWICLPDGNIPNLKLM
jgi:hypothetical protein